MDTNYLPAVLKWVEMDALPDWLGGTSKGTLLDDVGPWSDPKLVGSFLAHLSDPRTCTEFSQPLG